MSATVAWAVVALLATLPLSLGTVQQAHADSGSKTVQGPPVWQPAKGTYGPNGSVTVTPVDNLTDQVVHVSWKGFTPTVNVSGGTPATNVVAGSSTVRYPVRVYECRGSNPQITDCYGSTLYGGDPAKGFQQPQRPAGTITPDLPTNMVITVTGADGSGSADIETWTADQSPTLGCDATHPCSIVVEPEYGGDSRGLTAFLAHDKTGALHCDVHTYDTVSGLDLATDSTLTTPNYVTRNETGEGCAWSARTVVPLSFAPTASSCKAATSDFATAGLPMAERALQQWRAGACLASSPLNVGYTAQGEPQARQAFLGGGGAEVALTSRPDTGDAPRPYVYTPLANSAISVVFTVDDPVTGRQIPQMRLNPRLLAKELTQSYTQLVQGSPTPASVAGNPSCIFEDPEFLALNPPSLIAPAQWPKCVPNMATSLPIVVGNSTDLIHQLTAWIAGDPAAAAFLQGQPDEWGMHVDPYYERPAFSGYPVDLLIPQDSTGTGGVLSDGEPNKQKQYEWSPVISGLTDAVRDVLTFKPTCSDWNVSQGNQHAKCDSMKRGQRELIGIIDSADAEADSLPEAQLLNAQGSFVTPSIGSMQAAVNDMPVDLKTYTQQLPYGVPGTAYTKDSNAYPLTMVQYAMAPTAGLSAAKATAVSQFLQQVTDFGGGQLYGRDPGKLGPGYTDLTQSQEEFAQEAVQHVAAQDSTLPGNQVAPTTPPATPPPTTPPTNTPTTAGSPNATAPVGNQGPPPAPVSADQPNAPSGTDNPGGGTGSGTSGGTNSDGGSGLKDSGSGGSGSGSGGSGTGGDGGTGAGTGSGANPPGDSPKPSGSPAASASPTPSPSTTGPATAPVAAGIPAADRAGVARVLLPVVLIVGAVLLVGGPAALVLGGTSTGAEAVARLRRFIGRGGPMA
ncbi:hypothetical protein [Kitasatospora kifunensis]|uniref:PBP domain-containing protein n=1 Tax=Kitasatospora kifunensis TaxID=58351 RepID=A0A7W7R357_KITKI|nr:hypothetical protein [Kitasatospora kifunensis]MBB4924338.1 hypothetical protein [Kitasatospora kifunensis]